MNGFQGAAATRMGSTIGREEYKPRVVDGYIASELVPKNYRGHTTKNVQDAPRVQESIAVSCMSGTGILTFAAKLYLVLVSVPNDESTNIEV